MTEECLPWGWYLQVDFQLFILGVILLYIYSKSKKIFLSATIGLSVLSLAFIFIYCQSNNVKIYADIGELTNSGGDFFDDVYVKPYGRCFPYFMGLIFGVFFMEYRSKYYFI